MPPSSQQDSRASIGDYSSYEAAKHAWRLSHPDATAEAYSAAMLALAEQLGV